MAYLDAEDVARIRAKVEDGRIPVGSPAHLRVIEFEIRLKRLPPRDRRIVLLATRGYSDVIIASVVGLSRSRINQILAGFFKVKANEVTSS